MKDSLLFVHQDRKVLAAWEKAVAGWPIACRSLRDPFAALQAIQLEPFFAVVCHAGLPLLSGPDLCRRIRRTAPSALLVLAAEEGAGPPAEIREGAPWDIGPLRLSPERWPELLGLLLLVSGILLDPRRDAREIFFPSAGYDDIVGRSARIREIFSLIDKVRDQDVTVLIQGESGTGKELAARAIHRRSRRASRPFISVNCAALPETLLESELFGHEKGAFTGASARVIGRFEQADQGCLFLDEIGDMSPATQAKILRVLEGHEFERVGGREKIRVDVRIIAATNRDLRARVAEGKFRQDLFYRLEAFPISLPPLRERREDIPLLAAHILRRPERPVGGITLAAAERLLRYPWPGNVRELENVVGRAAILSEGGPVDAAHVQLGAPPLARPARPEAKPAAAPEGEGRIRTLREAEEEAIRAALLSCGMNVSRAAKGLGISRATLYNKAKEYGIALTR